MKILLIGALVIAQSALPLSPARAASLHEETSTGRHSMGAFAGARLRVQLGRETPTVNAGLALAPVSRTTASDGSVRLRFGEGVAFGVTGQRAPGLMLAGRPLEQKRAAWQDENKDDDDDGLSPVAIGAIVIGGLAAAAAVGYVILISSIESE